MKDVATTPQPDTLQGRDPQGRVPALIYLALVSSVTVVALPSAHT